MCGILGVYGFNEKESVRKAGRRMVHRGPDMSGSYSDYDLELFHRRLSILDLSKKGKQPMESEDGRFVIVYNGEIYNFKEIRKRLERKFNFKTDTDTEVVLYSFQEKGERCLADLEGDFAFAVWDSKKREIFLARDRIGVKPLYYFYQKGMFVFASEYKSIIPFLDRTEVNKQALSDYMGWGFNPGNETMLKGVFSLPPGNWARVSKRRFEKRSYWDVYTQGGNPERIPDMIEKSVKQRLISDVPLGVYLSGGLDSSSVVAALSESANNLKTFSVGFDSSDVIDETKYAEKVAEMYNTDHKNFVLDESSLKHWPKIAWHLDEPISNLSALPLYVMSKKASKDVSVVLSGNGGDECFAGYRQHQLVYNAYKYSRFVPRPAVGMGSKIISGFFKDKRKADFSRDFLRGVKNPEESYNPLVFKDMKSEDKKALTSDSVKSHERFVKLRKKNLLNDLKYIDLRYRAANNYLIVDDKVNMANSVESRVPLFDHNLVGAAWNLSPNRQVSLSDKKIYLKKLMEKKLPREVIYRKKYGFTSPLRQWFNSNFQEYKEEIYTSGLFNKKKLDWWFKDHEKNNKKINVLWTLTNAAIWKKRFIDKEGKKPNLTERNA